MQPLVGLLPTPIAVKTNRTTMKTLAAEWTLNVVWFLHSSMFRNASQIKHSCFSLSLIFLAPTDVLVFCQKMPILNMIKHILSVHKYIFESGTSTHSHSLFPSAFAAFLFVFTFTQILQNIFPSILTRFLSPALCIRIERLCVPLFFCQQTCTMYIPFRYFHFILVLRLLLFTFSSLLWSLLLSCSIEPKMITEKIHLNLIL